jgi:hypothetical protein
MRRPGHLDANGCDPKANFVPVTRRKQTRAIIFYV